MPISIILLGVLIIFLNFKIGYKTIKQFPISYYMLDIVCLLSFLLLCIRPIVLYEHIYVNLGGFFVLSCLAVYFLFFTKIKVERKKITSSFLTFFMVAFLLQLLSPYLQLDIFENKLILFSIIIALFTHLNNKSVVISYSTFFIGYPILSLSWFLLKEVNMPYETLLLGTGNLFEMAAISFATVLILEAVREPIKKFISKIKFNLIKHKKENKYEL